MRLAGAFQHQRNRFVLRMRVRLHAQFVRQALVLHRSGNAEMAVPGQWTPKAFFVFSVGMQAAVST